MSKMGIRRFIFFLFTILLFFLPGKYCFNVVISGYAIKMISPAVTSNVVFSKGRGFYYEEFELSLNCPTQGAGIRYTLNGSIPSAESGICYTAPIPVSNTTIVRAVAFLSGMADSEVSTHTYIFPEKVIHQSANPCYADGKVFPAEWNGVTADYAMDPRVLAIEGRTRVVNALLAIPSLSVVMNDNDLFQKIMNGGGKNNNDGLESPASMEMLYPARQWINFQTDCGFGPRSRNLQDRAIKRGFEIMFRGEFGPTKLRLPVFFDAPRNTVNAAVKFDNLILRPGFCDTWSSKGYDDSQDTYTRDPMTREAYLDVAGTGTHNHFVHLYLNGLYWGLYNLTEKINEKFLTHYLGAEDEDWLVVKSHTDSDNDGEVNNGDDKRYRQLLDLIGGDKVHGPLKNLYDDQVYQKVCQLIDPLLFAQYIMVHCYHGTGDWPDNNWYFVMCNHPPKPGFFQVWDAEKTLANYGGDGREHAWYTPLLTETNTRGGRAVPSRMWKAMITNPDFRMTFADEVYRSLVKTDGELTSEKSLSRWAELNNFIGGADRDHAAIIGESARWGDVNIDYTINKPARYSHWIIPVNRAIFFLQSNVEKFYDEFYDLLNLPQPSVFFMDDKFMNNGALQIDSAFVLTMENPNGKGTVYYRTDSLDPRIFGGESRAQVREGTEIYSEPFSIGRSTGLRSRVYLNGEWSPLNFLNITILSSLSDEPAGIEVKVYPNPFKEIFYIQIPPDIPRRTKVEIYHLSGKLCWSEQLNTDEGEVAEVIPGVIGPGSYLLLLRALDSSVLIRKMIIKTE